MANATKAKTKLPPGEYDVLKALIERGGDKSKVATVDLDKKMVNALKARKGFLDVDEVKQGRGTSVKSAKVLVKLDDFERVPNRASRGGGTTAGTRTPRAPRVLSIEALERFIVDYRKAMTDRAGEVAKEADAAIADARKAVGAAKTDDEAEGAAKRLQAAVEAKRQGTTSLSERVLREMSREVDTPLTPVIQAMLGKG